MSQPSRPTARAAPLTITRRPSRAEERRRRGHRRRLVALVAAVVMVIAGGVAAGLVTGIGHPASKPRVTANVRTQHTLLFQLRGPTGDAVESALVAHDSRANSGVEVLIPARVIVEVPGSGSAPFGSALALPNGALLSRDALSDLLGITVDSSWVISESAFATLIDRVGGVHVTVDTTVTTPLRGGGAAVVLNAGPQTLDGAHAVIFATYVGSGQPPVTALPRLQAVLDGLMAAIPKQPAQLSTLLSSLGPGSVLSGLPPSANVALIEGFARDDLATAVSYSTLPVDPIDTGAAQLSYRIDPVAVHQLVTTQLAGSIPPGVASGSNRVLVENGVGTPGLGLSARGKLVRAGFQFVGSRNAPQFGHRQTIVLIFSATPQAEQLGARVARALGVPASSVRLSTIDQSIADVIVILGADYRP